MANLKDIRKRISSVKSTQKITRAMKLVAAARLRKAQQAILELRPYAVKTMEVLSDVAARVPEDEAVHPLLERREVKDVMLVVLTSDRGLAGAFNSNINKAAFRRWKELEAEGKAGDGKDSRLRCPKDGTFMQKEPIGRFEEGASGGVMIDRCAHCGSLWLDKGVDGLRLDRKPQSEHFIHLGRKQGAHAKPAMRFDVDEPFGAQPHERLAHGNFADAELGSDGVLEQRRAR